MALVGCFGGGSNQCISSFRVAVPTDGVRDNRLTCGLPIYCVVPWNRGTVEPVYNGHLQDQYIWPL